MPRIQSAKKRMRQAKVARERNRAQRSQLRTAIKQARAAVAEERLEAFRAAERVIDRMGRKGLIHPNAAARQKSRLAKTLTN